VLVDGRPTGIVTEEQLHPPPASPGEILPEPEPLAADGTDR
jgi:hypothetical protein